MTRLNDVIWLRFHSDITETPPVEVNRFQELTKSITDLASMVADDIGLDAGLITLSLVAPPRRGCLDIPLLMQVSTDVTFNDIAVALGVSAVDLIKAFEEHLALAEFIAAIVFGPGGVVDRFSKRGQVQPLPPPERQLLVSLSERALANPQVVQGTLNLINAATNTAMNKVEIVVRDAAPVTIFSSEMRVRRGLIGSRPQTPLIEAPRAIDGRETLAIRFNDLNPITVRWEMTIYQGYIAFSNNPNRCIFVLWAPSKPPTGWSEYEVRGMVLPTSDIDNIDPATDQHEQADGAFLVETIIRTED